MTRMNSFGEFVDAEPPCAYPRIAAIDPKGLNVGERDETAWPGRYEKECAVCGARFRTSNRKQVTCSHHCSAIRKREMTSTWKRRHAG